MSEADSSPSVGRRPLTALAFRALVAALLVREAFSFWTGHPFDFESWVRTGYVVSNGENPYSAFWPPVPGVSFAYFDQNLTSAAYLPFWPVLLGALYRLWESLGTSNRFVLYFLLKQPGILADVATAYLLYRLVERWTGSVASAESVLVFWSFFPYAIVITAVWGQFDSIVVVVLLGLLYARGPLERAVLDGVGILVKWVTVIFLPLELFRERGVRRLGFLAALALPLAVTVLVFVAEGWGLRGFGVQGIGSVALSQSQGGGLGMNYAFLLDLPALKGTLRHVRGFYTVAQYLWVPGVVVAGWAAARGLARAGPREELDAMLLVVTVFLLLRWGLYEQYLLYLFGLLVLDVAAFRPGRRPMLLFTIALAFVDLLVNNDFGIRFVAPVVSGASSFSIAIDANNTYGLGRTVALAVLAGAVTITLAQLIVAFGRNEPAPLPWPTVLWRRGIRQLRRVTSRG